MNKFKLKKEKDEIKDMKKGKATKFKGKGELTYQKGKMFNDISYYNKNTTITQAFGNVPYSYIVGGRIPGLVTTQSKMMISGIMSYIVDWCVGPDGDINSDSTLDSLLDQVKSIIYNEMRRANAGSTNQIEPIDILSSNIVAAIDILCDSANIHRIFKIINSYSWRNRMIPRELCRHIGIDYDDLVANQANYRGRFDTLVAYAKTIRLLKRFSFPEAAWKEYTQVFKDEDTNTGREQLIIGLKAFHHIYDPVGTEQHPGGQVRLMEWRDLDPEVTDNSILVTIGDPSNSVKLYPLSLLLDILSKKIQRLVDDADFNLIQADLEKAFGNETDFLEVDKVVEDIGILQPVYSGEFMNMFHNGNFPDFTLLKKYNTTKDRQYIDYGAYQNVLFQYDSSIDGQKKVGFYCWIGEVGTMGSKLDAQVRVAQEVNSGFGRYVDTNIESPTADDNIIFTRYKFATNRQPLTQLSSDFAPDSSVCSNVQPITGSSNFICFGNFTTSIEYDGAHGYYSIRRQPWDNMDINLEIKNLVLLNYNNYPQLWKWVTNAYCLPVFPVNNIRKFNISELGDINSSCFLSLWNVPAYANI